MLGANDGIVSTASLIIGVASAGSAQGAVLVAGLAGLVAGAMSMAAGEYVSVSSQTDAETADLDKEAAELKAAPDAELDELAGLYVARGLDRELARQVAVQLSAGGALEAHARDELGIQETTTARPVQAALVSALSFASGASVPLVVAYLSTSRVTVLVSLTSLAALALLGALGAYAGGAPIVKGALRVSVWGALAMGATAAVGAIFGVSA